MKKSHVYIVGTLFLLAGLFFIKCSSNSTTNPLVPIAPSGLEGMAITPYDISLLWHDNSNDENGFYLYRRLSTRFAWTKIATLPANLQSYIDTNLTDTTEYSYYICSFNAAGSSPGTTPIAVTTPSVGVPPEAPYEPFPLIGSDSVSLNPVLSWNSSDPDGDTVRFDIYLGLTNPPYMADTNRIENVYYAHNLVPDTLYHWKVIARDNHGHRTPPVVEWYFRTTP